MHNIHKNIYIYMHAYIHKYTPTCLQTHIHHIRFLHTHTYAHSYSHPYIHACVHIYMHACMHTNKNRHVHTHRRHMCVEACTANTAAFVIVLLMIPTVPYPTLHYTTLPQIFVFWYIADCSTSASIPSVRVCNITQYTHMHEIGIIPWCFVY